MRGETSPSGYIYDASGNVLNDGLNQYQYDAEGRMCAVKSNLTGGFTGYIYDAGGNRVAKGTLTSFSCDVATNGFATTRSYVVDAAGREIYAMDGSGNWQHTNVFVGGQVLATYNAAAVHYYLGDWLGTKRGQASVTISGTTATHFTLHLLGAVAEFRVAVGSLWAKFQMVARVSAWQI